MLITRLYSKTIYFIVSNLTKNKPQTYLTKLALIECLQPNLFNNYSSVKAYLTNVRVLYNNIESYQIQLNGFTNDIIENNKINISQLKYQYISSNLGNIFTNSNGLSINLIKEITKYKNSYEKFIMCFNKIKGNANNANVYNLKMLSEFEFHVTELTQKLIELSHK